MPQYQYPALVVGVEVECQGLTVVRRVRILQS